MMSQKKKKVLSKFMILCWAAFTAILGSIGPVGRGWTPLQAEGVLEPHSLIRGVLCAAGSDLHWNPPLSITGREQPRGARPRCRCGGCLIRAAARAVCQLWSLCKRLEQHIFMAANSSESGIYGWVNPLRRRMNIRRKEGLWKDFWNTMCKWWWRKRVNQEDLELIGEIRAMK